jgi:hypothetical protein
MISEALKSLGVDEYTLKGLPKNEEEFNKSFRKVTGADSIKQAILSSNPSDFGVTWAQVEAQIKIEKEKVKKEQYKETRRAEYPTIEECVHAILDNDLDALQAKRKLVKEKHLKP